MWMRKYCKRAQLPHNRNKLIKTSKGKEKIKDLWGWAHPKLENNMSRGSN